MKYKLVTFYLDHREGKPIWHVYGHIAPGENESLGEFQDQAEAIDTAFEHGDLVMRGRNYALVLDALHEKDL